MCIKHVIAIVAASGISIAATAATAATPNVYGVELGMSLKQATASIKQYAQARDAKCSLASDQTTSYSLTKTLGTATANCQDTYHNSFTIDAYFSSVTKKVMAVRLRAGGMFQVLSHTPTGTNFQKAITAKYGKPSFSIKGSAFGGDPTGLNAGGSYVWYFSKASNGAAPHPDPMCNMIPRYRQFPIDSNSTTNLFYYHPKGSPKGTDKLINCGKVLMIDFATEGAPSKAYTETLQRYDFLLADTQAIGKSLTHLKSISDARTAAHAKKYISTANGNF